MFSDTDQALLETPAFAKLATLMADGTPQITVMWYRAEGDTIRMIAPASARKARNLERDPRATVAIDHPENGYRYLELRCRAEVVHDDAVARAELGQIAARYIGDRASAYVASLSADPRILIILHPEQVRSHLGQPPMSEV